MKAIVYGYKQEYTQKIFDQKKIFVPSAILLIGWQKQCTCVCIYQMYYGLRFLNKMPNLKVSQAQLIRIKALRKCRIICFYCV